MLNNPYLFKKKIIIQFKKKIRLGRVTQNFQLTGFKKITNQPYTIQQSYETVQSVIEMIIDYNNVETNQD